jgi:AraC-like DNA-binding protein
MKHQKQLEDAPLNFSKIAVIKALSEEYSHLGQDYLLSHITTDAARLYSDEARRFDGHTMIVCVKGTLKIEIDSTTVDVPPSSLLFVAPGQVFQPIEWIGNDHDAYLMFTTSKFANDLNIDLNAINTNIFTSAKAVVPLNDGKAERLIRYFEMLHQISTDESRYNRLIAKSLMAAAAYQVMAFGEENMAAEEKKPYSRKLAYAKTFLHLVRDHHCSERSIGFYADKMCISPKYLSFLIKDATGRSAADWIDQYVIQEAKNLLRYSGKNVQQVAYELNFSNQSSFGKYFKHITGMTPTQFQNK